METAKVDIRRLQLLNDRINQCLDALNQVRLSVHGLSHSGLTPETQGGMLNPLAQDPRFSGGAFAASPSVPGWVPGLSHSAPGYGAGAGFLSGIGGQAQVPFGPAQTPFFNPFLGLSHSSPENDPYSRQAWADPYLALKVAQTFPYARFGVPPVVTLY
jgi:hypothetical protein